MKKSKLFLILTVLTKLFALSVITIFTVSAFSSSVGENSSIQETDWGLPVLGIYPYEEHDHDNNQTLVEYSTCGICKGKGIVTCWLCKGTGQNTQKGNPNAFGPGRPDFFSYLDSQYGGRCSSCYGAGYKICNLCNGTGVTDYANISPPSQSPSYDSNQSSKNSDGGSGYSSIAQSNYNTYERATSTAYSTLQSAIIRYKRGNEERSYVNRLADSFRDSQRKLRDYRQEANSKGAYINASPWETASLPSY
jgi:hypothetical protein